MEFPKFSVPRWVQFALVSFIVGFVFSSVATRGFVSPIAWPACENAKEWFLIINSEEDSNDKFRLRRGVKNLDDWHCQQVVDETVKDLVFPAGTILWGAIIAFTLVKLDEFEP